MYRRFIPLFVAAVAFIVVPAHAVMTGGNEDTTNGAGVFGFDNIGSLSGGSAVYIGNNWVLTANHVGAGAVSFPTLSGSFSPDGPSHILLNPDNSNSDLLLFHVSGNLSALSSLPLATSAPTATEPITMIGNGYGRSNSPSSPSADAELFWQVTGSQSNPTWTPTTATSITNPPNAGGFAYETQAERWGNNTVAVDPTHNSVVYFENSTPRSNNPSMGFDSFFYNDLTDYTASGDRNSAGPGEATIADGDSGGGVFSNGVLVGINDEKFIFPNQPSEPNPVLEPGDPNTAVFGDGSFFIDISSYEAQIATDMAPEPVSLSLVSVGFAMMLRRRGRTIR